MGTYVRYPCAHTTKKPLPTVGGFLERLVKRDANPTLRFRSTAIVPDSQAKGKAARGRLKKKEPLTWSGALSVFVSKGR